MQVLAAVRADHEREPASGCGREDVFPIYFERRFVEVVDEDVVMVRLPRAELEGKVRVAQALLDGVTLAEDELRVRGSG